MMMSNKLSPPPVHFCRGRSGGGAVYALPRAGEVVGAAGALLPHDVALVWGQGGGADRPWQL